MWKIPKHEFFGGELNYGRLLYYRGGGADQNWMVVDVRRGKSELPKLDGCRCEEREVRLSKFWGRRNK